MLRFCRYFFLNFPHKHKSNVSGICILDDILDRAGYCDSRGGVCWCSSWHLVSFLLWDKNCLPFMAYFSDYQVCYRKYLNIVSWVFDTFAALLCKNTQDTYLKDRQKRLVSIQPIRILLICCIYFTLIVLILWVWGQLFHSK